MDGWWSRLLGNAPKKAASKSAINDSEVRLAKFKRLYHTFLSLVNRPRDTSTQGPLFEQLQDYLKRITAILRDESRAPAPHLSLQFAASNRIYAVIARAATISQHEAVIKASIAVLAALVDSEEEDFVSNVIFAKSLMRLATSILDGGTILINSDTESAILELLFTITAKIRLQPEILPFWFQSTAKQGPDDVFQEKQNFVGSTQKHDFPVCYLFVERVHYEGRIGDFARTGLLYIFEATGASTILGDWIVASDLPTLLASGLGALYSQLSRELSILHPDVTLPAVLALSDYSTTHARATAVSAFSDKHKSHMSTFLAYLAFWQDLLDHCQSEDVRDTLLDHFQILFLQQLLYPSLLQSSDIDAGSSIAVLIYMTAILESLEHEGMVAMTLRYLLAIDDKDFSMLQTTDSQMKPSRSPTTARRRQRLLSLTAPKNSDDALDPSLFSLVDLVLTNLRSKNSQAVFAALKLGSTILDRQKTFTFGTLLTSREDPGETQRTIGALELEVETYTELAQSIHNSTRLEEAFDDLADDLRLSIESQMTFANPLLSAETARPSQALVCLPLSSEDPYLKALNGLLQSFFTNGVDINLALSQALVSIALCPEIRLDSWFALDPTRYATPEASKIVLRPWEAYLEEEESTALIALRNSSRCPAWIAEPMLYSTLLRLVHELDRVRKSVPNLDHLIATRKMMLQANGIDSALLSTEAPSLATSPTQVSFQNVADSLQVPVRSSSLTNNQYKANDIIASPRSVSRAASPESDSPVDQEPSLDRRKLSIFMPPPPEAPSTSDVLMRTISFPSTYLEGIDVGRDECHATLNHVLTNIVILQDFIMELVAVLQVRAAVLGEREVKSA